MSDLHAELPANAFDKQDDGDDLAFYAPPRLVAHIDDTAVSALTAYYARVIPQNAVVLDLMSSWISHLPAALATAEVIGHGMNVVELQANDRLIRWFIADLNATPSLPLPDDSIDVALCCVGFSISSNRSRSSLRFAALCAQTGFSPSATPTAASR